MDGPQNQIQLHKAQYPPRPAPTTLPVAVPIFGQLAISKDKGFSFTSDILPPFSPGAVTG